MSEELQHPLDPIGMAAYESYRIVSDGKSLASGQPLPPWQELPGATREAWRAAADGAVMANALPAVEVDRHRWYAVVKRAGEVVAVIGITAPVDGLGYYDTVEDWERANT